MPKIFFLWIAVGWTVVIAYLCLVTFEDLPGISVSGGDKIVHCAIHFIFTVLWFFHFKRKYPSVRKIHLLLFVGFMSIFYGIFIELCQEYFTSTRQADLKDVFANSTGAAIAVIALWAIKAKTESGKLT